MTMLSDIVIWHLLFDTFLWKFGLTLFLGTIWGLEECRDVGLRRSKPNLPPLRRVSAMSAFNISAVSIFVSNPPTKQADVILLTLPYNIVFVKNMWQLRIAVWGDQRNGLREGASIIFTFYFFVTLLILMDFVYMSVNVFLCLLPLITIYAN